MGALEKALARTRGAGATARTAWTQLLDDGRVDEDEGREALEHAEQALRHLDAGRWDDARASAELCTELAEACSQPRVWRNFVLLVEEAAETGIAVE